MPVDVTPVHVPEHEDIIARCLIHTEDGIGDERRYRVSIDSSTVDGKHVLKARQEAGPEGSRPHITDTVSAAARRFFEQRDYDLFGDGPPGYEPPETVDRTDDEAAALEGSGEEVA